jgi:hypothetical protein
MVDRLHLAQTKCLEFQREAYFLSREPTFPAYHLREVIVLANLGFLRK